MMYIVYDENGISVYSGYDLNEAYGYLDDDGVSIFEEEDDGSLFFIDGINGAA